MLGGYLIERFKLVQGNADLVNPDGKGLFTIDLRNQYMADRGARPAPADAARLAQPAPADVPLPATVGGTAPVPKAGVGKEPVIKAPAVTGLSRGRGGNGRTHPSQGEID